LPLNHRCWCKQIKFYDLFIHLSVYPTIYLCVPPSVNPSVCLSVHLFMCSSVEVYPLLSLFFVVCLRFYSLFFVLVSLFISVFCGFCLNYLLLPYCLMYFSLVLSKLRWRKRNNKPSKQNLNIHVHRKTVYININLNHSLGEITNSIIINRKIR
jgi:hypothetical protein